MEVIQIDFSKEEYYKEVVKDGEASPSVNLGEKTLRVTAGDVHSSICSVEFTAEETAEIYRLLKYLYKED